MRHHKVTLPCIINQQHENFSEVKGNIFIIFISMRYPLCFFKLFDSLVSKLTMFHRKLKWINYKSPLGAVLILYSRSCGFDFRTIDNLSLPTFFVVLFSSLNTVISIHNKLRPLISEAINKITHSLSCATYSVEIVRQTKGYISQTSVDGGCSDK